MIIGVSTISDTNAILWFVFEPRLLTTVALAAIQQARLANELYVATITLVELDYLETKLNFAYPGAKARIEAMLTDPNGLLQALDLTIDVAGAVAKVPRNEVPDMPDRIIAATAVAHQVPLVSSDSKIRNSTTLRSLIPVIW